MYKDKIQFMTCLRCENDYTDDFQYGLCNGCQEAITQDYNAYLKGEDGESFDIEFCKEFNSVEEIFESYKNNIDLSMALFRDDNEIIIYDDDLGEYNLLLEYLLNNDIIIMSEYEDFEEMVNYDLDHWKNLLELCLDYIEEDLDNLWNDRDITDYDKYKEDLYLKKIRYLTELKLDIISYDKRDLKGGKIEL